jgi:3',5'-cyclic AMP phosphodiesterase CpdA
MRTIVHLSDLHFGRIDQALLTPLAQQLHALKPDLLIVSGDLTQRARSVEFIAARRWLDTLPTPSLIVPGNHDIPLHNLAQRLLQPLVKYRRYITNELAPFFQDEEIAVLGINTARALTIKDGRINPQQLAQVGQRFASVDPATIKIIVSHHPFELPDGQNQRQLAGRADSAMQQFADCRIDLLLSGHLHTSHAISTTTQVAGNGFASIAIQAGTATSTRGRGEANAFNIIRIDRARIMIESLQWQAPASAFVATTRTCFNASASGWQQVTPREDAP